MMDDQWQPAWKLVALRHGAYVSWIDRDCAVTYLVGVVARPRPGCGPLTVYCRRGAAEAQYARPWGEVGAPGGIVPCAYLPSTETELWSDATRTPLERLPDSTRLATAVVLWPAACTSGRRRPWSDDYDTVA